MDPKSLDWDVRCSVWQNPTVYFAGYGMYGCPPKRPVVTEWRTTHHRHEYDHPRGSQQIVVTEIAQPVPGHLVVLFQAKTPGAREQILKLVAEGTLTSKNTGEGRVAGELVVEDSKACSALLRLLNRILLG